MNQTLAIALGAVCGIVGAIPSGVLFERALKRGTKDSVSVEAGLASTMASFLFLSAAIYVAHLLMGDYDLWFGAGRPRKDLPRLEGRTNSEPASKFVQRDGRARQ